MCVYVILFSWLVVYSLYIIFMVSCIFSLFIIPKCKSSQMYLPQWYSFFLRRFCKWLIHTDFQAYIRKDCFTYIFHFLNSSVQFVCTIQIASQIFSIIAFLYWIYFSNYMRQDFKIDLKSKIFENYFNSRNSFLFQ